MSNPILLSEEQLEALASLIADRLASRQEGELIDAAELAKRIGRSRAFVYEHAAAFGAMKLGAGDKPRLAFRWPQVLDRLTGEPTPAHPVKRPTSTRRRTETVDLLPIRGRR